MIRKHQRHVGLAEQDDACFLKPLNRKRARLRHVVLELGIAPCRRGPGEVVALLYRHRHAVEWPPSLPSDECRIRLFRSLPCPFGIEPYDCVELGIVLRDTREEMFQGLSSADLPLADKPRDFDGGLEMK